jgi:protein CrcB
MGGVLRYLLSTWVHRLLDNPWFPYGTLLVNITGCLAIGFLASLAEDRAVFTSEARLFIFIGILGGFTTFSSFALETFSLARTAKERGLAGATVLRGREGFGARSRVHTARILDLSTDLPIIVEIVDTLEKIDAFLPVIDNAIKDGLATVEKVQIRFYRSGMEEKK